MADMDADAWLVEAIQRGEPDAWREVIRRYEGRLSSFARRMLAQRSDAEDLVQDTFVGLLRSLKHYDQRRSLETYLFAILRHKLADYLQKQQKGRRESLEQLDVEEAPSAWIDPHTPAGELEDQERIAAQRTLLGDALRQWVEQCRAGQRFADLIVVEMLVVLGLRNKEVAADLGLTETAVAGIKFRVLEQWRKATQAAALAHEIQETDLDRDSTVGRVWREEGLSCLKRSTLGRHLLGALDAEWQEYVDFHVSKADCARCQANIEDLRSEDERDAAAAAQMRERCFASSVGFLSRGGG